MLYKKKVDTDTTGTVMILDQFVGMVLPTYTLLRSSTYDSLETALLCLDYIRGRPREKHFAELKCQLIHVVLIRKADNVWKTQESTQLVTCNDDKNSRLRVSSTFEEKAVLSDWSDACQLWTHSVSSYVNLESWILTPRRRRRQILSSRVLDVKFDEYDFEQHDSRVSVVVLTNWSPIESLIIRFFYVIFFNSVSNLARIS